MPSIVAIRNALSSQVVKRLAAANYPPLADGQILLGRQHVAEQSAPPRIVLIPTDSEFSSAVAYSRDPTGSEGRTQIAQRPIATDQISFEVRCWGASTNSDPSVVRDDDYTMTEALYEAVVQAACAPAIEDGGAAVLGPLTSGGVEISGGHWTDASYASAQHVVLGREFVFTLRAPKPITDVLLPYAAPSVRSNATVTYASPATVTPETGCSGG